VPSRAAGFPTSITEAHDLGEAGRRLARREGSFISGGITVIKNFVAASAIACAALGVLAPAASAASAAAYRLVGTFFNHDAAAATCAHGIHWSLWSSCEYRAQQGSEHVTLWVE
jgi:hypothetical protein